MIIKKPYAFLIKHFRAIHLLLSLIMLYLLYKSNDLFKFYNGYAKNGFYEYSNSLASKYLNLYMFISIIVLLLLTAFIYFLMRWKKKSRLLYISISIFYFILFIAFLFNYNILDSLGTKAFEARTIRAIRDVSLMIYIPQYIYLTLCTIRAIGFDIKKFDFKKDLAELDIAEEDQEEVEVTFGENNYKLFRFFRRAIRELKYYIVENRVFITMIAGVVVLIISFTTFLNLVVYKKTYNESDVFQIDGIYFQVENSYVTDVDLNGKMINKYKKYIVINLSIDNHTKVRNTLNTSELRLLAGNKDYYPTYSLSEFFNDLGETYYKNTLYPGEKYNYLLVYEVPYEIDHDKVVFRMIDNINFINGQLDAKYRDVTLTPEDYMSTNKRMDYPTKEVIGFEETVLKNSEVIINDFAVAKEFTENYNYCFNNNCYPRKKIITRSLIGKGTTTLVKLDLNLTLDKELYINRYIKSATDFIKYYGTISYVKGKKEIIKQYQVIEGENIPSTSAYIEVDEEINSADEIYLNITIRNKKYRVKLK